MSVVSTGQVLVKYGVQVLPLPAVYYNEYSTTSVPVPVVAGMDGLAGSLQQSLQPT
jgi:hypothetical protein